MKKIAIITILALFVSSGCFAATNSVNNQQNRNNYNNRNVFNKTTLKTNSNGNYLEENVYANGTDFEDSPCRR